jgi:hypothetical protein
MAKIESPPPIPVGGTHILTITDQELILLRFMAPTEGGKARTTLVDHVWKRGSGNRNFESREQVEEMLGDLSNVLQRAKLHEPRIKFDHNYPR